MHVYLRTRMCGSECENDEEDVVSASDQNDERGGNEEFLSIWFSHNTHILLHVCVWSASEIWANEDESPVSR